MGFAVLLFLAPSQLLYKLLDMAYKWIFGQEVSCYGIGLNYPHKTGPVLGVALFTYRKNGANPTLVCVFRTQKNWNNRCLENLLKVVNVKNGFCIRKYLSVSYTHLRAHET